jgi:hypothetical protein
MPIVNTNAKAADAPTRNRDLAPDDGAFALECFATRLIPRSPNYAELWVTSPRAVLIAQVTFALERVENWIKRSRAEAITMAAELLDTNRQMVPLPALLTRAQRRCLNRR